MAFIRSKSFSDYHHDSSDDYHLLSYLSLPNINITYILCKLECSNPLNHKCSTQSMHTILNNSNHNKIDTELHLSAVTSNELLIGESHWLIKDKTQQLSHSSTVLLTNKMDSDSLQNIASLCWHENFNLNRSSSLFTPSSFRSECLISYTEENDILSFDDGESLDTNKPPKELNAPSAMCINHDSISHKEFSHRNYQQIINDNVQLLNQMNHRTLNKSHSKHYFYSYRNLKMQKTKFSPINSIHSLQLIPHIFSNYFNEQQKKLNENKQRRKTCYENFSTNNLITTTINNHNQSIKKHHHFLRHFSFTHHDSKPSSCSNYSNEKILRNHNNNNNNNENLYHVISPSMMNKSPRLERKFSKLAIGVRDKITTLCRASSSVTPQPYSTDLLSTNHRIFLEKLFRSGGPTRENVEDWAHSFESVLRDKYGVLVFREFLRKEFSDENIRFWLICEDYRNKSSTKNIQRKALKIFNEYVAVQAAREVNLDSKTRLQTEKELESANKNTFDQCQRRIQSLMEKDSYRRFLRSDLYLTTLEMSKVKEECNMANKISRHSVIDFRGIKNVFNTVKRTSAPSRIILTTTENTDSSSSSTAILVSENDPSKITDK